MLLLSCARDIQNQAAVKQGVLDYLNQRQAQTGLDMKLMQVDVTSVTFQKDTALATVAFRPKSGAGPGEAMQMSYTLERKGDKWVVKNRAQQGGANPHGSDNLLLPPPAAGQGTPQMPAGHPPVPDKSGAKK